MAELSVPDQLVLLVRQQAQIGTRSLQEIQNNSILGKVTFFNYAELDLEQFIHWSSSITITSLLWVLSGTDLVPLRSSLSGTIIG